MTPRKCLVWIDGQQHEATFHQFGNQIIYGSDNEPLAGVVAVVELGNGQSKMVAPDKVRFLEAPAAE